MNIGSLWSHSPRDSCMGEFLVIPVELYLSGYTGLSLQAGIPPEATLVRPAVENILIAG